VRARLAQKKTATGSVDAQWQLRVQDADYSPLAESSGHRFHRNMRVPETSLVSRAYCDVRRRPQAGLEMLDTWVTSSDGSIGSGPISVEAIRKGDDVWALIHREE
jgi:hypothetical protein